jgi:hypothetical protein
MNIEILNATPFVKYKREMGLLSHYYSKTGEILFMHSTGDTEIINESDVVKPLEAEIEAELLTNDNLRSIARDAGYIFVRDYYTVYLNYCKSYS